MTWFDISMIALASAAKAAVPGPGIVLTVGRSANGGVHSGLSVGVGLALANLLLCMTAMAIVHGAFVLSDGALFWIKWSGVIALAVCALFMLRKGRDMALPRRKSFASLSGDIVAGLMVGVSSPVNLVFFLTLLPQVVPEHGLHMALVVSAAGAVLFGVFFVYIAAALAGAATGGLKRKNDKQIRSIGAITLLVFAIFAATSNIQSA